MKSKSEIKVGDSVYVFSSALQKATVLEVNKSEHATSYKVRAESGYTFTVMDFFVFSTLIEAHQECEECADYWSRKATELQKEICAIHAGL